MAFGIAEGWSHSYGCSRLLLRSSILFPTSRKLCRNLQRQQDDGLLNKQLKKVFKNFKNSCTIYYSGVVWCMNLNIDKIKFRSKTNTNTIQNICFQVWYYVFFNFFMSTCRWRSQRVCYKTSSRKTNKNVSNVHGCPISTIFIYVQCNMKLGSKL